MIIGIDISQVVFEGTGVGRFVRNLTFHMVKFGYNHTFVLFGSSLRKKAVLMKFVNDLKKINPNIKSIIKPYPPVLLSLLWNKWHILPIEYFIGSVDVYMANDWVQPPLKKALGVSFIFDMSVYKYPQESHNRIEFDWKNLQLKPNIVSTQKQRLNWIKNEAQAVICDSESTRNDVHDILKIPLNKLQVVYPGLSETGINL